jgi:hypothetical protein
MKAFWLKKVLSMSPCGRAESAKLELPTDTIQAVAFSHDGRLLAGGDWGGRIGVWEL